MKIGFSHIRLLRQVVVLLFPTCLGLPCRVLRGTLQSTAYGGVSATPTLLGAPNILAPQVYLPPYNLGPTYPAYSTPSAQPGLYTYSVFQPPPRVLPNLQGPYGVSLFHEVAPPLPLPESHQGVSSHRTQPPPNVAPTFPPSIPPTALTVTLPQKRSATNTTQQNVFDKPPLKERTVTVKPPQELYVPEDKFLPPTLHRFAHDVFPYDDNPIHHNTLSLVDTSEKSLHDDLKNCSLGVDCSTADQGRDTQQKDAVEREDTEKTKESDGLMPFKSHDITFGLKSSNVYRESESYMDSESKDQLTLHDLNGQMKQDLLNVSKLSNTTTLSIGGIEETLKTIDLNIHPGHFETQEVYNSKRDTHSTSFVDYSPDNSTTRGRKEMKPHPCRCLQKLKKCVHDARNVAEYLVKTACTVFGSLEEYDD